MRKQRMTTWQCEHCRRLWPSPFLAQRCEDTCKARGLLEASRRRLEEARAEVEAALREAP